MADGTAALVEEEAVRHIQRTGQGAAGWTAQFSVQRGGGVYRPAGAAKSHPSSSPHPEAVRQREGHSAGKHSGGGGRAPSKRGRAGVPTVRGTDAGDRDRGAGDVEADPGQSHFAPRCILHLCL